MTYVGKILVIVIMIFAVGFLFLSTMVFMTERNWKQTVDQLKTDQSKLSGQITELKTTKQKLENDLVAADKAREGQVKQLDADIINLKNDNTNRANEVQDLRKSLETAQQGLRAAQQNAEAKEAETVKARDILDSTQKEANAYHTQQLELKDRIRILERELEQAQGNNKSLREANLTLQDVIRQNGLNADPNYYQRRNRPLPRVDGQILKADNQKGRFQISIGTDDGIDTPDELYVYRLDPKPEYLGKIRVQLAASDQAVATLIGKTVQGKKIQEGDIVSTEIRARD